MTEEQSRLAQKRRKRKRPLSTCLPKQLHPKTHIPNKGLFYSNSFIPKVGLPTNHRLNGPCEPKALLQHIFQVQFPVGKKMTRRQKRRWKGLCERGVSFSEAIFRRHKTCDYHRILDRCCPLPALLSHTEIDIAEVAAAYSRASGVIEFLSRALRHVLPMQLLGSHKNFEQLLLHVGNYVRLRRQETLANKSILKKMKITHASWLFAAKQGKVHRSDHQTAQQSFLVILRWIFQDLVIPLLAANFYVTESEMCGRQVMYYRKPVWSIFRSLSMKKLLTQQFEEITREEARHRLSVQQMGLSRLRLLPKETGVRPIATLCKQELFRRPTTSVEAVEMTSNKTDDEVVYDDQHIEIPSLTARRKRIKLTTAKYVASPSVFSTNQILRDVFAVLRFELSQREDLYGAGVDGLHYFYPKYRAFVQRVRSMASNQLFFVSVDIQHAYDAIEQNYLLSLLDKIMSEREYYLQRYDVFHPFASVGRIIKRQVSWVRPIGHNNSSHMEANPGDFQQSVFVESADVSVAGKTHLSKQLHEHLKSHLVTIKGRFGDRYLLQRRGIPQGSVLSTMLCNFFYGAFERKALPSFLECLAEQDDSSSLLIRMVDDFLLATTNEHLAAEFLEIMEAGDHSLGIQINKAKTKVSKTIPVKSGSFEPDQKGREGFFPWCGMLFDLKTYAVRVDYERLIDAGLSSGLTVERSMYEGKRFSAALRTFIRPRCIPILFDSCINDKRTQAINFFELYLFAAAKATAYLRSSDLLSTLDSNLDFIVNAISECVGYGFYLVQKRLRRASAASSVSFSRRAVEMIGHMAFLEVIRRVAGCGVLAARLQGYVSTMVGANLFFQQAMKESLQSPVMKKLLVML